MQVRVVGQHAVLVGCAGHAEVAATYALLRGLVAELGAVDLVPAARTVLVDGVREAAATAAYLATIPTPEPLDLASAVSVEVPVVYDGVDLVEVARQWEVEPSEVVRIHTDATFRVAFCGFSPGFAYCTGLPPERTIARRQDPRTTVPAGSVALAGEFTGVYPRTSPGGWQLIGRTSLVLWDPDRPEPALLLPGTTVRFVAVDD